MLPSMTRFLLVIACLLGVASMFTLSTREVAAQNGAFRPAFPQRRLTISPAGRRTDGKQKPEISPTAHL